MTTIELQGRIDAALAMACFGTSDGEWHKAWVIDQMVRCLTGSGYEGWVKWYKAGEDGPDTYSWDEGVAP